MSAILLLVQALAAAWPAAAQTTSQSAFPGSASLTEHAGKPIVLDLTCSVALTRYCPTLAGTNQRRNQVICLRPYRLDLAAPCRRAVDAALR